MKMKFNRQHGKKQNKETRDKDRVINALASRLVSGNLKDSEKIATIEKLRSLV